MGARATGVLFHAGRRRGLEKARWPADRGRQRSLEKARYNQKKSGGNTQGTRLDNHLSYFRPRKEASSSAISFSHPEGDTEKELAYFREFFGYFFLDERFPLLYLHKALNSIQHSVPGAPARVYSSKHSKQA
ncbi:unnamed protein product [Miscanthus lutarioriparius]|uniref:Uncharacterized protein n=1 Tax=Miscanthus lutarioriparius TaxID=422564 RepID=A0A811RW16_9POAL|nr:unnamed protein product [Miscanthus lutarioriparius]